MSLATDQTGIFEEKKPRIILRPYQNVAVRSAMDGWREGMKNILETLPTGAGKTIIFTEIARLAGTRNVRSIVFAHREELLTQAIDKIHMVWPGASVGLIRAGTHREGGNITVASVQSMNAKRLERVNPERYGLVIIDEAHHSAARSYQRLFDHFGNCRFLGVTATPGRADGKGLKRFEKIVYKLSIPELVKDGYLAPISPASRKLSINLDQIKIVAGDFNKKMLGELFHDVDRVCVPVVLAWHEEREAGNASKGLVFCVDVQHSEDMAAAFRAGGVRAAAVHGKMNRADRAQTLAAFARGDLEVLTNCNVLTEGFDEPSIDICFMCRPTKSEGLYIQMVGRGLRTYPGKEKCRVIDFVGSTKKHRLVQAGNFLKDRPGVVYGGMSNMRLHWVQSGRDFILQIQDDEGTRHAFKLRNLNPNADIYQAEHKWGRNYNVITTDVPLTFAQGQAEEIARHFIPKDKLYIHKANAAWRKAPPSDKQVALLTRFGIPVPATKGEAGDLLTQHFNR